MKNQINTLHFFLKIIKRYLTAALFAAIVAQAIPIPYLSQVEDVFARDPFTSVLVDFEYDRNGDQSGSLPARTSSGKDIFELDGWNTVLRDVYTYYRDIGPEGLDASRGGYNYQGIQGTNTHQFETGERVQIVWYNNSPAPVSFTPEISFNDPDRKGSGTAGDWQELPITTIEPYATGITQYSFTEDQLLSFINIRANNADFSPRTLSCDKILYTNEPDNPTPPQNPTQLEATARTENTIELSWNSSVSSDVAGYKIYRNNQPIGSTDRTTYTDTRLTPNTEYTYIVTTYNFAGTEAAPSLQTTKTTPGVPDSSWQNKLENNFCGDNDPYCTVDTFDHYQDWRVQKNGELPRYLSDDRVGNWKGYQPGGYASYTEDEKFPINLTNWGEDKQVGTKSIVLGNKATTEKYPGHNGPSDICMYFGEEGNTDGSSGYADVYVFFRAFLPANHYATAQEEINTKIFMHEPGEEYMNTGQKLVRLTSGWVGAYEYHCAKLPDNTYDRSNCVCPETSTRCDNDVEIITTSDPRWARTYIGDTSSWFNLNTSYDAYGEKRSITGFLKLYTSGDVNERNNIVKNGFDNIKDQLGAIELHYRVNTEAGVTSDGWVEIFSYDKYGNRKLVGEGNSSNFLPYASQQNHKFNRVCFDGHIRVQDEVWLNGEYGYNDIYFTPGSGMDTAWWMDDVIIDDQPVGDGELRRQRSGNAAAKGYFELLNEEPVAPEVDFAVSSLAYNHTGHPFQFEDKSMRNPHTWLWNFGDGVTSSEQHPTHTYDRPGKYTVTLTASNDYGTATETKSRYIQVTGNVITLVDFVGDNDSTSDSQTIIDQNEEGWSVIKDTSTRYYIVDGYTGTTEKNGSYNYQGIQSADTAVTRSFTENNKIVVTWYNGYDEEVSFIPHISFDDPNRRTYDYSGGDYPEEGTWYSMGLVTIAPHSTKQSIFEFDSQTSGEYSIVSVNNNFQDTNRLMLCDKIQVLTFDSSVPQNIRLLDVIHALQITAGYPVDIDNMNLTDINNDQRIGLVEALYGLQVLANSIQ